VHQVTALYADCFLPLDTRALADVLHAIGSKMRRDGNEEKYGSLVARAKAELYELAGADLTGFSAARGSAVRHLGGQRQECFQTEAQRPRG
jgi:hypothetical protein